MTFDSVNIRDTIHGILKEGFRYFSGEDMLMVERLSRQMRVFYVSGETSEGSNGFTSLDCRFDLDSDQMWIGSIQVAAPFRLQGLGTQLVNVGEAMARAFECGVINVLPFQSSLPFWRKMGYTASPHTVRVFRKHLKEACPPMGNDAQQSPLNTNLDLQHHRMMLRRTHPVGRNHLRY